MDIDRHPRNFHGPSPGWKRLLCWRHLSFPGFPGFPGFPAPGLHMGKVSGPTQEQAASLSLYAETGGTRDRHEDQGLPVYLAGERAVERCGMQLTAPTVKRGKRALRTPVRAEITPRSEPRPARGAALPHRSGAEPALSPHL
ncbi:protein of unknown function [Magnetospirillum gryphiswaldense MSR-1 v2]|uniref:Uncharacterized protein n=1 Tax=Magnetospirillum gryphiswaldense (strain DSM 6361 / JCM 21280 / NBRC 15271 / MSR-1) TaxID=431944 RepID=V6EVV4_MAGGM|nr:protein of unknown function [Magnetospirillum gryphiswaldense MSR-1 v2]